jgi:AraC family transcriptional regulator, transcriptional activator of the genes for pyochelin and ferripyochelin receptors
MALLFNSGQYLKTVYHNPICADDLNVEGLTESRESVFLDSADMTLQNWCLEGFRMARFNLEQRQETSYKIKNNIDAVKIYFNRRGSHHSEYQQLSKSIILRGGQCNMLYSDDLDTSVTHIDKHSEIFSLQLTRECFIDLLDQGSIDLDQFGGKLARKQPALVSPQWLSINTAMDKCISDIISCPFRQDMKKIYLHSKAIELFVLFAHSVDERKEPDFQMKNPADRERLYFAKDYLVQNYANPNSLATISKITGLNEFKLKQGFKLLFNSSVIDFLINYRLEKAHELLLNTQKTISEVAYETGYTSAAYFGKAFKKKYGYNPGNL